MTLDGLAGRLGASDCVTIGMDLEMVPYNIEQWYTAKKNKWPLNYGTTVSQEAAGMVGRCTIPGSISKDVLHSSKNCYRCSKPNLRRPATDVSQQCIRGSTAVTRPPIFLLTSHYEDFVAIVRAKAPDSTAQQSAGHLT